jgi:hypothetical protein
VTDHKPGASLTRELVDHQALGEWTEHEIHGFIASRHKQRVKSEGEHPEEPLWGRELEGTQRPCRRGKRRPAGGDHRDQAARLRAVMASLVNYYEAEASKYGCGTTEGAPWTIGSLRVYYRLPTSPTS